MPVEAVKKKYRFETSCVNSTAEKISAMTAPWMAKKVKAKTFFNYVDRKEVEKMLGYEGTDLRIRNDWHVGFYRSRYDGKPCYFLVHSAIEYVWVDDSEEVEERSSAE